MKTSQKIFSLGLLAVFAFFASGLCSFPVAANAATHAGMSGMDMSGGDPDSVQDDHQMETGCSACDTSRDNFNACSLSCGSVAAKSAIVKKTVGSSDLLPVDRFDLVPVVTLSEADPLRSPPRPSLATEALLSVSKKE